MARFVAAHLLDILARRQDLVPETLEAVRAEVHRRLDEEESAAAGKGQRAKGTTTDAAPAEPPLEMVEDLHRSGKLDETAVANALQSGDHEFVIACSMRERTVGR